MSEANNINIKITNTSTANKDLTVNSISVEFKWTDSTTKNTTHLGGDNSTAISDSNFVDIETTSASSVFPIPDPSTMPPAGATITEVKVKVTYSEQSAGINRKYEILDGSNPISGASVEGGSAPTSGNTWDVTTYITSKALADNMQVRIRNLTLDNQLTVQQVQVTYKWTETITQTTTPSSVDLTTTAANQTFAIPDPPIDGPGATITEVKVYVTYTEAGGAGTINRKYEILDGSTPISGASVETTGSPTSGNAWDVTSYITSPTLANSMQVKISNLTLENKLTVQQVQVVFKWTENVTPTITPATKDLITTAANQTFDIPTPSIPGTATIQEVKAKVTYTEAGGAGSITRKYQVLDGSNSDAELTASGIPLQTTGNPTTGADWNVKPAVDAASNAINAANALKIKISNLTLENKLTVSKVEVYYKWSESTSPDTSYSPNPATTPKVISTPTVSQIFSFTSPGIFTGSTVQSVKFTVNYSVSSGTSTTGANPKLLFEAISNDATPVVYASNSSPPTSGNYWDAKSSGDGSDRVDTVAEANQVRLRITILSSDKTFTFSGPSANDVKADFQWQNPNPDPTKYSIPSSQFVTKLTSASGSNLTFAWDESTQKGLGSGDSYAIPRQGTFYFYIEDTSGGYPKWTDVTTTSSTVVKPDLTKLGVAGNNLTAAVTVLGQNGSSYCDLAWTLWRDRGKESDPDANKPIDVDYISGCSVNDDNYRYRRTTGTIGTANPGDIGTDTEAPEPTDASDSATKVKTRWVDVGASVANHNKPASLWSETVPSDYKWNGDSNTSESPDYLAFGRAFDDPNGGGNKYYQYIYLSANDSNAGSSTAAVKVPSGYNSKDYSFRFTIDSGTTRWFTIDNDTLASVDGTVPITPSTKNYDTSVNNFAAFKNGVFVFMRDEKDKIPQASGNASLYDFTALSGGTLPDPPALPDPGTNTAFSDPWVLPANSSGQGVPSGGDLNNRFAFPRNIKNPNDPAMQYMGIPNTPGTVTLADISTAGGKRGYFIYDWEKHYSTNVSGQIVNNEPDYFNDLLGVELTDPANSGLPTSPIDKPYVRRWLKTGHFIDTATGLIVTASGAGTVTLATGFTGSLNPVTYPRDATGNPPTSPKDWTNRQNYMAWVTMALDPSDCSYDSLKVPTFYNLNKSGNCPISPLKDYSSSAPYPLRPIGYPGSTYYSEAPYTIDGKSFTIDLVRAGDRQAAGGYIHFDPPVLADASDLTNTFNKTPTLGKFPYSQDSYQAESGVYQWIQYGSAIWNAPPNKDPKTGLPIWPHYELYNVARTSLISADPANKRYSYAPKRLAADPPDSPTGGWIIFSGCSDTGTAVTPCVATGTNQSILPTKPSPDNNDNWQFYGNYSGSKADLFYTGALIKLQIQARQDGDLFRYSADNTNIKYKHPTTKEIYTWGASCDANATVPVAGTKNVRTLTDPSSFCDLKDYVAWQNLPIDPNNDVYKGKANVTTIPTGYPDGTATNFFSGDFATPIFPDRLADVPDYPEPDPAQSPHVPTGSAPYDNGYINTLGNAVTTANADDKSSSIRYLVYGETWPVVRTPNDTSDQVVYEYTYGGNMFFPISTEYPVGYKYEQFIATDNPDFPHCKTDDINGCKTPVSSDPHYNDYRLSHAGACDGHLCDTTKITKYIRFSDYAKSGGVFQPPIASAAKTTVSLPAGTKNTKWFRYAPQPVSGDATNPYWDEDNLTLDPATGTKGKLYIGTTLYSERPRQSLLKDVGDSSNTISVKAGATSPPLIFPSPYPYDPTDVLTLNDSLKYGVNWLVKNKKLNRHYQYNASTNLKVQYTGWSWTPLNLPFDPDNVKYGESYTIKNGSTTTWTTAVPPGYDHKHKLVNCGDTPGTNSIYTNSGCTSLPDDAIARTAYVTYKEYQDLKTTYANNPALPTPGPKTDDDPDPGFEEAATSMIRIDGDHYWYQADPVGGDWGIAWGGKGGVQFYGFGGDVDAIVDAYGDNGSSGPVTRQFGDVQPGLLPNGKEYMRYELMDTNTVTPWRGYANRKVAGVVGGGFFKNPSFGSIIGKECETVYAGNVYIDPDHGTGYPVTAGPYPWNLPSGQTYTFPADYGDYPTENTLAAIVTPVNYNRTSQINRISTSGGVAVGFTSWREDLYLKKPYGGPNISPTRLTDFRNSSIGSNAYAGEFHNDPDHDGWSPSGTATQYPRKPKPADGDTNRRYIIHGEYTGVSYAGLHYHRSVGIGVGNNDRFSTEQFCQTDQDGCQPYEKANPKDYGTGSVSDKTILDLAKYAGIGSVDNTTSLQSGIFVTWTKRAAEHPAPAYHHYEGAVYNVTSSYCGSDWLYGKCGEFSPFNPDNADNSDPNKDPNYVFQPYNGDGTPKSKTGPDQGLPVGYFWIGLEQKPLPALKNPGYEGWWEWGYGNTGTNGFGWDVIAAKDHGSLFNKMRAQNGNKGFYDPNTKQYPYMDTYKDHPYGTGLTIPAGNGDAGAPLPLDLYHLNMGGENEGTGWHNIWGVWRVKENHEGRKIIKLPPSRGSDGFPASGNLGIDHIYDMNTYPPGWWKDSIPQSVFCYGNQYDCKQYIELWTFTSKDSAFIIREKRVTLLKRDTVNDTGVEPITESPTAIVNKAVKHKYIAMNITDVFFVKVDPAPDPAPVWKWNSLVSSTTDKYEVPRDEFNNPPKLKVAGSSCSPQNGPGDPFPPSKWKGGIATHFWVPLNTTICYFERELQLGVRPSGADGNPTEDISQSDFWIDVHSGYDVAAESLPTLGGSSPWPRPVSNYKTEKVGVTSHNSPYLPLEEGDPACTHFNPIDNPSGTDGYHGPGTNPSSPSTVVFDWSTAAGTVESAGSTVAVVAPSGSFDKGKGPSNCGSSGSSTDPNSANWVADWGAWSPAVSAGPAKPVGGTYYLVHYALENGHWECVDWCNDWNNHGYGDYHASNGSPYFWTVASGVTLSKLSKIPLYVMRRNSVPDNSPIILYTRPLSQGGVVNDSGLANDGGKAFAACHNGMSETNYACLSGGYFNNRDDWRVDVPQAAGQMTTNSKNVSYRIVFGFPHWIQNIGYPINADVPANCKVPYDATADPTDCNKGGWTNIPLVDASYAGGFAQPPQVWYTDEARMTSIGYPNENITRQYQLNQQFWMVESTPPGKTVTDFKAFDAANPYVPGWKQVFVTNAQRTSNNTDPNAWGTEYWQNTALAKMPYWTGLNYQQYALLDTAAVGSLTANAGNNFYEKWTPGQPFQGIDPNSSVSGYYKHVDSGKTTQWNTDGTSSQVYKDNGTVPLPYFRYQGSGSEVIKTVYTNNPSDTIYLAQPGKTYVSGDTSAAYPTGTLGNLPYNRRLYGNKHIPHNPNIKWELPMGASETYEIWTLQNDDPNSSSVPDYNTHNDYKLTGTSGQPERWLPLDGKTADPMTPGYIAASTIKTVYSGASDALFPGEWITLTTLGPFGGDVNDATFKNNNKPTSGNVNSSKGKSISPSGNGNILYRVLTAYGIDPISGKGCEPETSDPNMNGCKYVQADSIAAAKDPAKMVDWKDFSWGGATPLGWVTVPPSFPFALGFANFNYDARSMLPPEDPLDGAANPPNGKFFVYAGGPYDNSRSYIETKKWPIVLNTVGADGKRSSGVSIKDPAGGELKFTGSYRPISFDDPDLQNNALYRFSTDASQGSDGSAFQSLPGHKKSNDPFVYVTLVTGPDGKKRPKSEWYFDYLRPRAPAGTIYDYQPYSEAGESDRWVRTGIIRIGTPDPIPKIFITSTPPGETTYTGVPVDDKCTPPVGVYYKLCGSINWIQEGKQRVPLISQASIRDPTAYARWRIIYFKQEGTDPDTGMPSGDVYEIVLDNPACWPKSKAKTGNWLASSDLTAMPGSGACDAGYDRVPVGIRDDGTPLATLLAKTTSTNAIWDPTGATLLNNALVRKLTGGSGGGGGRASVNIASFRIDQTATGAHLDVTAFRMIDGQRPAVYRTDTNVSVRSLGTSGAGP